jgi:hypothetical protein
MAGGSRTSRTAQVLALVLFAGLGLWVVTSAGTASAAEKVWVCKYVGKPGEDESLKEGQNPIEVSINAAGPPGSLFNDAQGRSYVIAYSDGGPPPTCPDTPPGPEPTESPTCPPTPTATADTESPTPPETESPTPTKTASPTPTETETPTPTKTATPTPSESESPTGTPPETETTTPGETETPTEATSPTEEPLESETACPTGNCPTVTPTGSPTASPAPPPTESESPTPTVTPTVGATESTAPTSASPAETTSPGACQTPEATGAAEESAGGNATGTPSAPAAPSGPGSGTSPESANGGSGPTGSAAGLTAATSTRSANVPGGVRIVIPSLHVDAPVVGIGMVGRTLQPPSDPTVLGRWSGGAAIGAAHGRALVTGHSVHDGYGALDALGSLRPGELVLVRTPSGWQHDVVTKVLTLPKQKLVRESSALFRQTGPGRLVLITCTGWNGSSYLSNVVVVARPVTSLLPRQLFRQQLRRSPVGE